MYLEFQLEEARREFLDECDMVVSVSATLYLEGSSVTDKAIVFPLQRGIEVGIIKKSKEFKITAKFADMKCNCLITPSKMVDRKLTLEFLSIIETLASSGKLEIDKALLNLLNKSEFRIWSPLPFESPLLNLDEDINTAFGILVFCLKNNITVKEFENRSLDWNIFIRSKKNADSGGTFTLNCHTEDDRLEKFMEMFKFCWYLQPSITNGASCFASLLGSWGCRNPIIYSIYHSEMERIKTLLITDIEYLFDFVNQICEKGLVQIIIKDNMDIDKTFSLLLAYSEEKKEKFWGQATLPYFFDEVNEVGLNVKTRDREHWDRKMVYKDGFFLFFAPRNAIENIKKEMESLQNTYLYYSSHLIFSEDCETLPLGAMGARILSPDKYKLPKRQKGKVIIEEPKPSEPEEKKAEINFIETEVQISGQNPLSKDNPLILAEYIILKEKVHWLWAFVILPEFETKRPKWQFRNYVSKKRIILKKYGIKITALKKAEDDYAKFEGIENKVKSNVQDAKGYYNKAIFLFKEHKLGDAINELNKIATSYYKWYSFTNAYLTLIEWIRMENFEGIAEEFITNCRDFLSWYIKRLQIGISRIEFYKKWLFKNKNKLDELAEQEFQKIKDELKNVEENLQALVQKVPLSKEDREYEIFVKFLMDIREKLMYVWEKEVEHEEVRQEVSIELISKLQDSNTHFKTIINKAFSIMGDELYRLDKIKTHSDKLLKEESREIYWFIRDLIIDLKNFDEFELKKGSKLGVLIDYFNKGVESKIKKWLSGRL
ncbi:MAG: hypothetical protein Q8O13_00215 [Candidatus Omnitrophota bacterium]|nr:hypothetical protein [Candidatus Omnitrophota bacterium]